MIAALPQLAARSHERREKVPGLGAAFVKGEFGLSFVLSSARFWADLACLSEDMEAELRALKLKSHIHRKGSRGKPLTEQGKSSNRTKSTVRSLVEHVFDARRPPHSLENAFS